MRSIAYSVHTLLRAPRPQVMEALKGEPAIRARLQEDAPLALKEVLAATRGPLPPLLCLPRRPAGGEVIGCLNMLTRTYATGRRQHYGREDRERLVTKHFIMKQGKYNSTHSTQRTRRNVAMKVRKSHLWMIKVLKPTKLKCQMRIQSKTQPTSIRPQYISISVCGLMPQSQRGRAATRKRGRGGGRRGGGRRRGPTRWRRSAPGQQPRRPGPGLGWPPHRRRPAQRAGHPSPSHARPSSGGAARLGDPPTGPCPGNGGGGPRRPASTPVRDPSRIRALRPTRAERRRGRRRAAPPPRGPGRRPLRPPAP
jgi:hypothetical protein